MRAFYTLQIPFVFGIGIADTMPDKTPGHFLLTRINIPQAARGKHYGSKLLKSVLLDADRTGYTLHLVPVPSGREGIDPGHDDLVAWYERYDFKRVPIAPGSPHYTMVRAPGVLTQYRGFELWRRSQLHWDLYRDGCYCTSGLSAYGLKCYVDAWLQP